MLNCEGYFMMKNIHGSADDAVARLFEVAGVLTDAMSGYLRAQRLTPARAEVIWRIGREGPMTQRQLSDVLRCTPRNVTGLVDALEDLGMVARRPHPSDRRSTLVTLTSMGEEAARQWYAGYRRLGAHLFGDLDDAEVAEFTRTLDRVVARLRDPAATTAAPD
jgi:DNA-binding MarR family transcriptional regulator